MKLELRSYGLEIIPETVQDEVYLETVLKLKTEKDHAVVKRVNAMGLSCWAYAEVKAA
jgi:hypothetical protein